MRGLTLSDWTPLFREKYGKGSVLAEALFRQYHRTGRADPRDLQEFSRSDSSLVERLSADLADPLPKTGILEESEGTLKYYLELADGHRVEAVILPMKGYHTLCVSSQVGCARGCLFCQTGRMGLKRNLQAAEIIDQVRAARFSYGRNVENLVFMGMGEPLDNLEEVLRAVDILSDPKGNPIHRKNISISTCGVVSGIRRLTELNRLNPGKNYRNLVLSLSLHSADDETRRRLMPSAATESTLTELRAALSETPQARYRNKLFYEYVLIPGVNDSEEDARKLLEWLGELPGKVNLIPWNRIEGLHFRPPTEEELRRFWRMILAGGRGCLVRISRGDSIRAACGQLGA